MASTAYYTRIQAIYFTFVTFMGLIVTPITTYYCIKIWKLRHKLFFFKRHPKLTIASTLSWCIWFTIFREYADIRFIFPNVTFPGSKHFYYFAFSGTPFVLIYLRLWFLYYDYNRGLLLVSKEWKSKILTTNNNNMNNEHWLLKYKWFSDTSYTLYYIGIIFIILLDFIVVISHIISEQLGRIVLSIFAIFTIGIAIFMTLKIRQCRDELFIQKEFKYLACAGIIAVISYIIAIFFNNEIKPVIFLVTASFCISFANYISTKWVINQYNNSFRKIRKDSNTAAVSLKDALKNEDAFELFAMYLVKEFSIENLLFLFETMRLKNECFKHGFIKQNEIGIQLEFAQKTNEVIRDKSIVDDIKAFDDNIKYIVNRYIQNGAELCINISSTTRSKLIFALKDTYHSKQEQKLADIVELNQENEKNNAREKMLQFIGLIDEAMEEVIRLLSLDSFARFIHTDEYKKIYS